MNILSDLHNIFKESELREDSIFFPEWNLTIQTTVDDLRDNAAILSFYLSNPEWENAVYECSVGIGSSQEQAIGMAIGSFVFGMMSAVKALMKDLGHSLGNCTCEFNVGHLQTSLDNQTYNWRVYEGDVVTIGNKSSETSSYWNIVKDDVKNQLGNQKISYIKIYGAKNGDNITGECRINDIASLELSKKIADYVSAWDVETFVSQKQFIFLRQEEAE